MKVDYQHLTEELADGTFESNLERELTDGFRAMREAGDPLPPPSYYATKIAEIVHAGVAVPLDKEVAWETVTGESR